MRFAFPWHEFVDLAVEMAIDDLRQDIGEPGLGIDTVEFTSFHERGDDCAMLAAAVRTGKECVFAIEGNRAD